MYLRFVKAKIRTEREDEFEQYYADHIKPELERTAGCLFAGLMKNGNTRPIEAISMTIWDTRYDAERYERSGVYQSLLDSVAPYILESDEWKMRLQDSDEPLLENPHGAKAEVSAFPIQTGDPDQIPDIGDAAQHYLRIVSLKVVPGEVYHLIRVYEDEIVPMLLAVDGCRTAFLVRDHSDVNHVMSITLWDSKEHAVAYEDGGLFDELRDTIKPMLAKRSAWNMLLDAGGDGGAPPARLDVSGWQVVSSDEFATVSSER